MSDDNSSRVLYLGEEPYISAEEHQALADKLKQGFAKTIAFDVVDWKRAVQVTPVVIQIEPAEIPLTDQILDELEEKKEPLELIDQLISDFPPPDPVKYKQLFLDYVNGGYQWPPHLQWMLDDAEKKRKTTEVLQKQTPKRVKKQ